MRNFAHSLSGWAKTNAERQKCKRGHSYGPEKDEFNNRVCVICRRLRYTRWYAKHGRIKSATSTNRNNKT